MTLRELHIARKMCIYACTITRAVHGSLWISTVHEYTTVCMRIHPSLHKVTQEQSQQEQSRRMPVAGIPTLREFAEGKRASNSCAASRLHHPAFVRGTYRNQGRRPLHMLLLLLPFDASPAEEPNLSPIFCDRPETTAHTALRYQKM